METTAGPQPCFCWRTNGTLRGSAAAVERAATITKGKSQRTLFKGKNQDREKGEPDGREDHQGHMRFGEVPPRDLIEGRGRTGSEFRLFFVIEQSCGATNAIRIHARGRLCFLNTRKREKFVDGRFVRLACSALTRDVLAHIAQRKNVLL